MDIRLFITETGQIALACHDGGFKYLIENVELDYLTTFMHINLQGRDKPLKLNCPVHMDALDCMLDQDACVFGYYLDGQLKGAFFVPFSIINFPQQTKKERLNEHTGY